jgi:hypothetical protein
MRTCSPQRGCIPLQAAADPAPTPLHRLVQQHAASFVAQAEAGAGA